MEITLYQIALGLTLVISLLLHARLLLLKSFGDSKVIYILVIAQTIALSLLAGYTFNPDWKITLQYVKVFLNWPAITCVIVLTLIYKFQNGISNWLSKIGNMKGNVFGQEFEFSVLQTTQQIEQSTEITFSNTASLTDLKFEHLPDHLKKLPNIRDDIEWVRNHPITAIKDLNRLTDNVNFERTNSRIYGSQIRLLVFLSNYPDMWHKISYLIGEAYKNHAKLYGNPNYGEHDYLGFLRINYLVDFNVAHDHDEFKISEYGKRFLHYIQEVYPAIWNQKPY